MKGWFPGLAQGFAALQGGVDLALVLHDGGELLVEEVDDFLLLGEGTPEKARQQKANLPETRQRPNPVGSLT